MPAPPVGPARNGLLHQTQRLNVDSAAGWIAAAVPLRHASDVPHRYVGWERHLRRARAADVFADSFTYNAHTTSVDVLWAGVPVLSRSAPAPRQQRLMCTTSLGADVDRRMCVFVSGLRGQWSRGCRRASSSRRTLAGTHPHLLVGAAGYCNGDTDAAGASGTASTKELCDCAPSGATEGRGTTEESVWSRKTIACQ